MHEMKFRSRAGERFATEPRSFHFAKRLSMFVLEFKKMLSLLIHYAVMYAVIATAMVAIWNAPLCMYPCL